MKSEEKIREAFKHYKDGQEDGPQLDEQTENERLRTLAWVLDEEDDMENIEFKGSFSCPDCEVELDEVPIFDDLRVCPNCDRRFEV